MQITIKDNNKFHI